METARADVSGAWRPLEESLRSAAAYSAAYRGLALLVQVRGAVVWEDYPNGGGAEQAHELASGTKSFCGILAAAAVADGLLEWDEAASGTLPEWLGDARREAVTIRQLLQLVSGMEAGMKVGRVPTYDAAVHARFAAAPGERFFYGAAPFQVFGEIMRRKLVGLGEDPLGYLQARVLDRLGLEVRRWRRGADHWPNLSAGAVMTARAWAKLGDLVCSGGRSGREQIVPGPVFSELFRGSAANPAYGMTWWLNAPLADDRRVHLRQATLGLDDLWPNPRVPRDLVYAAGAGKQRLYVSPALGLVIVRQAGGVLEALASGERGGFSDAEFLGRLLGEEG